MALFKITAKRSLSAVRIPQGTTLQIATPNGVNCLDHNKIAAAVKQQLGLDVHPSHVEVNCFNVERIS